MSIKNMGWFQQPEPRTNKSNSYYAHVTVHGFNSVDVKLVDRYSPLNESLGNKVFKLTPEQYKRAKEILEEGYAWTCWNYIKENGQPH